MQNHAGKIFFAQQIKFYGLLLSLVFVCFCADSVTSSTLSHLATTFEFKIRLFLDLDYFTMQTILLGLKKSILLFCHHVMKSTKRSFVTSNLFLECLIGNTQKCIHPYATSHAVILKPRVIPFNPIFNVYAYLPNHILKRTSKDSLFQTKDKFREKSS